MCPKQLDRGMHWYHKSYYYSFYTDENCVPMTLLWPAFLPPPPWAHQKFNWEHPWDLWTTKTHISFFGVERLLIHLLLDISLGIPLRTRARIVLHLFSLAIPRDTTNLRSSDDTGTTKLALDILSCLITAQRCWRPVLLLVWLLNAACFFICTI